MLKDREVRRKMRLCGIEAPCPLANGAEVEQMRAAVPNGARGGTHAGGGRPHRRTR